MNIFGRRSSPQSPRLRLILCSFVAAIAVALAATTMGADAASVQVQSGWIGQGQSLESLSSHDQFGTQDSWDDYVEFFPGSDRHVSLFALQAQGNLGSDVMIEVNYRGPDSSENRWVLEVLDQANGRWVTVFNNDNVPDWQWTLSRVTIGRTQNFVDRNGGVGFRYRSSNNVDVSQLDYVAVTAIGSQAQPGPGNRADRAARAAKSVPSPAKQTEAQSSALVVESAPTTTASAPALVASPNPVQQPAPDASTELIAPPQPDREPDPAPVPAPEVAVAPGPVIEPEPEPEPVPAGGWRRLPTNGMFDYQIGGDYALPSGVSIVSRDWFSGQAASGAYSICYVNAFQTQPNGGGNRPDELSRWPSNLVLTNLGDDPNWDGEYLIDLSTSAKRSAAAQWLHQMIDTCAAKGFDAVEFDNLDSWTRLNSLPFGQSEALAFATLLTDYSHSRGLAVAQKNTAEIVASGQHRQVGFDFAIAEQCGQYNECGVYAAGYGDALIIVEYDQSAFSRSCSQYGNSASVVLRDVFVRTPGQGGYVYAACRRG